MKQGAAVEDFMKPDRVVIGVEAGDERATEVMKELYAPFTRTGAPILTMDTASAELCKYAANSILATRISFMNEIANVCEVVGADVDHVRKAIGSDRRIGTSFLFPGVGYGGSCFPKDTQALLKSAQDKGYDFKILRAVEDVNDAQKERLVDKIERHFQDLSGKTIWLIVLISPSRVTIWVSPRQLPVCAAIVVASRSTRSASPPVCASRIVSRGRSVIADPSAPSVVGPSPIIARLAWLA